MISDYKDFNEFFSHVSQFEYKSTPEGKKLIEKSEEKNKTEYKVKEVLYHFAKLFSCTTKVTPETTEFLQNLQFEAGLPYNVQSRLEKNLQRALNANDGNKYRELKLTQETEDLKIKYKTTKVQVFKAGSAHFIGRRQSMEDKSLACPVTIDLNGKKCQGTLLGIFDGHGGDAVAKTLKKNLPKVLIETFENLQLESFQEDAVIFYGLKKTFSNFVKKYINDPNFLKSGSTANIALIINQNLWIANVGDSRAVIFDGKENYQLSEDAKGNHERYKTHSYNLGALVMPLRGTINNMTVARTIGDLTLAAGYGIFTTPFKPKITKFSLENVQNGLLLLACDGLYECLTTHKVLNAARSIYHLTESEIAKTLIGSVYKNNLSDDNISVIAVKLNPTPKKITKG